MAIGICKLTGVAGDLVKCHLIPKALTRPEEPGLPLIQGKSGKRVTTRWDSWYDKHLVTREGEDVLSAYDDWAIRFLCSQRLVWSGWGPMRSLGNLHHVLPGTTLGVRRVVVDEPARLRLFFLSLLWRAAASALHEFGEVEVPPSHLERLRRMVVNCDPGPMSFYPVSLTQLSTMGMIHNMAPIGQEKYIPGLEDEGSHVPIFRFYFDGLIAHVHRHPNEKGYEGSLGSTNVGLDSILTVSTVPYDRSFQRENLLYTMMETIFD